MSEKERQLQLVMEIANYLSEWVEVIDEEDKDRVMDIDESLKYIESYGVSLNNPCDELVSNAIRHLDDICNFWNKDAIPDVLIDVLGFTEEEVERYNSVKESKIWIQFG